MLVMIRILRANPYCVARDLWWARLPVLVCGVFGQKRHTLYSALCEQHTITYRLYNIFDHCRGVESGFAIGGQKEMKQCRASPRHPAGVANNPTLTSPGIKVKYRFDS